VSTKLLPLVLSSQSSFGCYFPVLVSRVIAYHSSVLTARCSSSISPQTLLLLLLALYLVVHPSILDSITGFPISYYFKEYFGSYFGFQHCRICYKQHRENKNKNHHFHGKGEDVVRFECVSNKGFHLAFFIWSYSRLSL
jgi:hypothetical protein